MRTAISYDYRSVFAVWFEQIANHKSQANNNHAAALRRAMPAASGSSKTIEAFVPGY
jgi:hypothetical protein